MPESAKEFLGRGWAYPVGVNRATGRVKLSEYERDIAEAIQIILSTRRGERVMRPEFGSNLHRFAFENAGLSMATQIKSEVLSALRLWEPRVTEVSVKVNFPAQGGGFVVEVHYVVRSTNNPFNLVFPFYLTEGNA